MAPREKRRFPNSRFMIFDLRLQAEFGDLNHRYRKSICVPARENTRVPISPYLCEMGPQLMYNQLQAGFLTCVLPRSSFPSGTVFGYGQWINASRISDYISEQALTAARPPRILTAFPFYYPRAKRPGTCN